MENILLSLSAYRWRRFERENVFHSGNSALWQNTLIALAKITSSNANNSCNSSGSDDCSNDLIKRSLNGKKCHSLWKLPRPFKSNTFRPHRKCTCLCHPIQSHPITYINISILYPNDVVLRCPCLFVPFLYTLSMFIQFLCLFFLFFIILLETFFQRKLLEILIVSKWYKWHKLKHSITETVIE